MKRYEITITMPDGSKGVHCGLYPSSCMAIIRALDLAHENCTVAARRLP